MLTLFTALMLVGQPPVLQGMLIAAQPATVFATVGHSEWCPAGNVGLDLSTGEHAFTATAPRQSCNDRDLKRPVLKLRLEGARLASVQQAYRRAQIEGLDACRDGKRPQKIVVSNGGTPILVLTSGAESKAAPDSYSCWSEAALQLHRALDDTVRSSHQR